VSECDHEASMMRKPSPTGAVRHGEKKYDKVVHYDHISHLSFSRHDHMEALLLYE
jgi:hypothetical protein